LIERIPTENVSASRRSVIVLALVAALLLLAAPHASAAGSIVCEQYPDLPQCTVTAGGGDGAGADAPGAPGAAQAGGSVPVSAAIPGAGSATGEPGKAGELPFTGYPLSPLAAAVLLLLTAGIAIRAYLAMRRRLSVAHREHVL
jgi:hypothetical protein